MQEFTRGPKKAIKKLNEIIREINTNKPLPGKGVSVGKGPSGSMINALANEGSGTFDDKHPFKGVKAVFKGEDDPPADQKRKIKILPGTVNNRVASNVNIELTVPNGGTLDVWIDCTLDNGDLLSFSYNSGEVNSTPLNLPGNDETNEPPGKAYLLLFRVTYNLQSGLSFNQFIKNSQSLDVIVQSISILNCQQKVARRMVFSAV